MSEISTDPATSLEMSKSSTYPGTQQEICDKSSRGAVTPQQMNDLRHAAKIGSVDELYSLISRDEHILDKIEEKPFGETPLHMAAMEGKTKFAMEVLRLKRSFTKKLNKEGYTPMHLALQNTQIEMVRCLLHFDEELVRVHGRDGLTPLHYVAQIGNLDLLVEFLTACPRSVEDVTNGRETVLHVALKYGAPDTCQLLLGWLRRTWFKQASLWEKKLLNAKDEEGYTVLDIAVEKKLSEASSLYLCFLVNDFTEDIPAKFVLGFFAWMGIVIVHLYIMQIVKLLLKFGSPFRNVIDLKSKDSRYLKKLKMLQRSPTNEGKEMVEHKQDPRNDGKKMIRDKKDPYFVDYFRSPVNWEEKIYIFFLRHTGNISDTTRNALLVVAALLLTLTYQTTVAAPEGIWSNETSTSTTNKFLHRNQVEEPVFDDIDSLEDTILIITSVLNFISFSTSIFSLILLLPTDLRSGMFGLPLYISSLCFLAALFISTPINVFIEDIPQNHYLLFLILSPILFLVLEGIVLYRRKKLVRAFTPQTKELDPRLHMFSAQF